MSLRRAGERALLLEVDSLAEVHALARAVETLRAQGQGAWTEVEDSIPAARTLLLVARESRAVAPLRTALNQLLESGAAAPDAAQAAPDRVVEIPVHYDGPDLTDVGELTGLGARGVVEAHTATPWTVAFGGFAPGFAYLVDGDPRLEVRRRESPRTVVPAGAVGLAGAFSGVYPRPSPGGWQLIGHTDLPLWDVDRTPPALLQPGWKVRFVEVSHD